jgi:hypothetical protein
MARLWTTCASETTHHIHRLLGRGWTDPLSGQVIVYYALKKGWASWHGEDGE